MTCRLYFAHQLVQRYLQLLAVDPVFACRRDALHETRAKEVQP